MPKKVTHRRELELDIVDGKPVKTIITTEVRAFGQPVVPTRETTEIDWTEASRLSRAYVTREPEASEFDLITESVDFVPAITAWEDANAVAV